MKTVWDEGRQNGRKDEFVRLSDESEDAVLKDAWKIVPAETRRYIKDVFGEDGLMVRKDMLNNTVGYREASIGDAWTGLSRLDEKTRKAFVDRLILNFLTPNETIFRVSGAVL